MADLPELIIGLQPKQRRLHQAILDQRPNAPRVIGFGGARGAAKSGGVRRIILLLANENPGIIIWLVRRVWDDLNKDHVLQMWNEFPQFKQFYRSTEHKIELPNGSTIFFVHSGDSGRAKRKARGPQAHYIFLEQAEEFSQEEMEQLAGSNRAPGVPPGYCKRIFTFNPGGIGTSYLRRVFHLREYMENEDPDDFLFIQGFGWDNWRWFEALGIPEGEFYDENRWPAARRFQCFIEKTDFGKSLNALPPAQRIGELMGSFEQFGGQYFAEVWEPSAVILQPDQVQKIMQPWWRRWIATDWGFSHWAATGWFVVGLMSIDQAWEIFQVRCATPVRVIIAYREIVVQDMEEPELARLIVSMTPQAERQEVRFHFIGQDAWAKKGSANTVVEQMDPLLNVGGLQKLSRADWDRVGGWRLMYNCWSAARRFRKWQGSEPYRDNQEDPPCFFVSGACTETISAIPMLVCDEDNPKDVRKVPGAIEDDVADMIRYGLKSYMTADPTPPRDLVAAETWQRYQDPTMRAMAMLRIEAEQQKTQYLARRRRF